VVAESSASSLGSLSRTTINTSEMNESMNEPGSHPPNDMRPGRPTPCSELRHYSTHLASSLLFVVYVSLRSLLAYDTFVCFKLTRDAILAAALVLEMLALIAWLLALVLITRPVEWGFGLHATYRLIYWNKAYEHRRSRGEVFAAEHVHLTGVPVRGKADEATRSNEINDAYACSLIHSVFNGSHTFLNKTFELFNSSILA
jgi:hypothetical protein